MAKKQKAPDAAAQVRPEYAERAEACETPANVHRDREGFPLIQPYRQLEKEYEHPRPRVR